MDVSGILLLFTVSTFFFSWEAIVNSATVVEGATVVAMTTVVIARFEATLDFDITELLLVVVRIEDATMVVIGATVVGGCDGNGYCNCLITGVDVPLIAVFILLV